MKYLFAFFLAFITFTSFAFSTVQTSNSSTNGIDFPFKKRVTLEAGTLVMLETSEKLDSRQITIGQLVQFKVKTNVYAEGRLVIRTGSLALGRIKTIQKASYNHPESITIEITSVQAIDGQSVALNPTEQTIKGTYTGQGFTMNKGKMVTANVMNDYRIKF